ncbi:MAG TPA: ornithine cyclodeaminase family protein [Rhizomicrobium sp.]|jgi:ornithine cyclodeaminase|nr:ornithine cyclodeaminase family protein [Rhizomicrobium sp.]
MTSQKLLVINHAALQAVITLAETIEIVDQAMRELSAGLVVAPERSVMSVNAATRLGLMPGAMPSLSRFGVKVVSLSADAAAFGLPSHQGLMLLFDSGTGQPLAALDCHALTRMRTAAASAAATRALARRDAKVLAIIGPGDLAGPHLDAISAIRPVEEVRIWGRSKTKADAFAAGRRHVRVAGSVEQAVKGADIICTLTSSREPLLEGAWLEPGQHLNLVGSSLRSSREADDETVRRAYFIADSRSHALSQAGELLHAIEQRVVDQGHVRGEIGEVLSGKVPGRTSDDQITIYKSLGHAAQDIALAHAVLLRAGKSDKVAAVDW